ncbi:MAG: sulfotransferase [Shimia sp.]|uniref:tetratricopeptide repeat-containing sulfotransferase family protein n=1 Tax=Shimia sp. TaxID=1954381 RepID=UPI001B0C446D|nr:tetratricopeptide repeat-containing sulfotransferase family protein [Shimia sp.]MBO6896742.1 sulfotransferase [Shimia sp.]
MAKVDVDPLALPRSLLARKQWQSALPLFAAHLKIEPDHAEALNGLGRCLIGVGDIASGVATLAEAVKLAPENVSYVADLGEAFEASGQHVPALECFDIAQKFAPAEPTYVLCSARVLYVLGQLELGVQLLEVSAEAWPENADVAGCYAVFLEAVGRPKEALVQWTKALELSPENSATYANFVAFRRPSEMDDFEKRLDARLKQKNSKTDEMRFRFAKVAVLEERGEYEGAYRSLQIANRRFFETSGFDITQEERLFEGLKQQFSQQSDVTPNAKARSATPIFILGLPRSGSSLTETILGCHSEVSQGGELDYLAPLVKQMGLLQAPLTAKQADALGDAYMSRLTQSGEAHYVTDKMPLNFRLIGHIVTALPQARIVHVYRDPKACCWSNFRHFFAGDGLGFTADAESLIRYFEMYQDLMAFWHERFPGRIIDVDYEALVQDPDTQIPTLIQALGLEWQGACLSPQDSDNVMRTASQDQVRKKIYQGSANGWRRYEAQAGGWLSRLPDHRSTGG